MRKTQKELQALYEEQQSETGKIKLSSKKDFIKKASEKIDLHISVNEVGILIDRQTGEKRYFMMKG